jgi:hypothetical protein
VRLGLCSVCVAGVLEIMVWLCLCSVCVAGVLEIWCDWVCVVSVLEVCWRFVAAGFV